MPEEDFAPIEAVGTVEGTVSFLDAPAPAEPEAEPQVEPEVEPEVEEQAEAEPETYSAEYVAKLKEEIIEKRRKAQRIGDANARLVAAYAEADGRLVDVEMLPYSDDFLDEDGVVDRTKVSEAITSLIARKSYLASPRPTTLLPQGPRASVPEEQGLLSFVRQRV